MFRQILLIEFTDGRVVLVQWLDYCNVPFVVENVPSHQQYCIFFFFYSFHQTKRSFSVVLKCLIYHLTEVPVDTEEHNLLIIMDKLGARQLQSVILLYDGSSVLGVILAGLNI